MANAGSVFDIQIITKIFSFVVFVARNDVNLTMVLTFIIDINEIVTLECQMNVRI